MAAKIYSFWKTKAGNVIVQHPHAKGKGRKKWIVVTKKAKGLAKIENIYKLFWAIKKEEKIIDKIFKTKSEAIAYAGLIAINPNF